MSPVPIQAIGTVTLDGSGNGTIRIGPDRAGWSWSVERLVVAGTSAAGQVPSVKVYNGEPGGQQIDSTYLGDGAPSEYPNPIPIPSGMYLSIVFANGQPGARHTAQPFGRQSN